MLIKKGRIITVSTPQELISNMYNKVWEVICSLEEGEHLQRKYKIGDIRQRRKGMYWE